MLPTVKIGCPKGNGSLGVSAEINGFKITGLREVNIKLENGKFADVTFTVACRLDIDAMMAIPNVVVKEPKKTLTCHGGNGENFVLDE